MPKSKTQQALEPRTPPKPRVSSGSLSPELRKFFRKSASTTPTPATPLKTVGASNSSSQETTVKKYDLRSSGGHTSQESRSASSSFGKEAAASMKRDCPRRMLSDSQKLAATDSQVLSPPQKRPNATQSSPPPPPPTVPHVRITRKAQKALPASQ